MTDGILIMEDSKFVCKLLARALGAALEVIRKGPSSPFEKRSERHEASEDPRNVRLYMSSDERRFVARSSFSDGLELGIESVLAHTCAQAVVFADEGPYLWCREDINLPDAPCGDAVELHSWGAPQEDSLVAALNVDRVLVDEEDSAADFGAIWYDGGRR